MSTPPTDPVALEPALLQLLRDAASIISAGPHPGLRCEAAANFVKEEVDQIKRLALQSLRNFKK